MSSQMEVVNVWIVNQVVCDIQTGCIHLWMFNDDKSKRERERGKCMTAIHDLPQFNLKKDDCQKVKP